jgi:hypothetical protein
VTGYSGPTLDGGAAVFNVITYLNSVATVAFTPPISVDWVLWVPGPDAAAAQRFPWGWGDSGNGPFQNELGNGIYALNFGGAASVPAAAPAAQRWHHFAFTYAALGLTFAYYIDGVAQPAPGAVAPVAAFASLLTLGRRNAAGNQWVGAMAEFAVYPAVLTGARVNAHFTALNTLAAPPVSGNAGGLSGSASAPLFTDLLRQILQSVRKPFVDL